MSSEVIAYYPPEVIDVSEPKVLKLRVQATENIWFFAIGRGEKPYSHLKIAKYIPAPHISDDTIDVDGKMEDISDQVDALPSALDVLSYLHDMMRRLACCTKFIEDNSLYDFVQFYPDVMKLMSKLELPDSAVNDLMEFAQQMYDLGDDSSSWSEESYYENLNNYCRERNRRRNPYNM